VPCVITINTPVGVRSITTQQLVAIRVSGTATGCNGNAVDVRVGRSAGPPPAPITEPSVPVMGGLWSVDVDVTGQSPPFQCEDLLDIFVVCSADRQCQQLLQRTRLQCPQPTCPDFTVAVSVQGCAGAGNSATATFTVTFPAAVTPPPGCTYLWILSGPPGAPPDQTTTVPSTSASYSQPPPLGTAFPGAVVMTCGDPQTGTCTNQEAFNVPIPSCLCPATTGGVIVTHGDLEGLCAGSGGTATVDFNVVLNPPNPSCQLQWNFGDATAPQTTAPGVLSTTHTYVQPSDPATPYQVTVTALCDGCAPPYPQGMTTVPIPACCPVITGINPIPLDCDDAQRSMAFTATTNPPGAPGTFTWDFGDGSPPASSGASSTSPSHSYQTPTAPRTIQVTFTPQVPGCPTSSFSATFPIPPCEEEGGGRSALCGSFAVIIAALLGVIIALGLLALVLSQCLGIPIWPTYAWIWYTIAVLGFAVALTFLIWYLICAFGICDCPSRCDLLEIGWMSTLIGALVGLYLGGCCSGWMWLVVAGLFAASTAMFGVWLNSCNPSLCLILVDLLVVFTTGAGTIFSFLGLAPPVALCGRGWVRITAAIMAGILAIAARITCASSVIAPPTPPGPSTTIPAQRPGPE
jgi:hypothetical protein